MMEPKTVEPERWVSSVALFLTSLSSVAGPQMVAWPRLKELGHLWMGACSSKGDGWGSKDMCTLMKGDDYEIVISI